MGEPERQFEIDVRPVIGPTEYQRLLETHGGKPSQKVFVKTRKNKTDDEGTVFERIQYWYPEGEFDEHYYTIHI